MDPSEHENQNASDSTDKGVGFVIIPFDYDQLSDDQKKSIVPICIASRDRHGNPIARIWFEQGVAPVQDHLRTMARLNLGDIHRVSELAERTVHKLWERHGEDVGVTPWNRVMTRAIWEARHMKVGGSPWRMKHTVPLALGSPEEDLDENGITDTKSYEESYERDLLVNLVERRIARGQHEDFREVFKMLRQGYTWDEVAARLAESNPEALKRRFWRWVKRTFPRKRRRKPSRSRGDMP
jgi:hypothetical protein